MPPHKLNGAIKYVGVGLVVALVAGATQYGVFRGVVGSHMEAAEKRDVVLTHRIVDNRERCDQAYTRIWRQIAATQEKVNTRFQEVQRELGGVDAKLDAVLQKLE